MIKFTYLLYMENKVQALNYTISYKMMDKCKRT